MNQGFYPIGNYEVSLEDSIDAETRNPSFRVVLHSRTSTTRPSTAIINSDDLTKANSQEFIDISEIQVELSKTDIQDFGVVELLGTVPPKLRTIHGFRTFIIGELKSKSTKIGSATQHDESGADKNVRTLTGFKTFGSEPCELSFGYRIILNNLNGESEAINEVLTKHMLEILSLKTNMTEMRSTMLEMRQSINFLATHLTSTNVSTAVIISKDGNFNLNHITGDFRLLSSYIGTKQIATERIFYINQGARGFSERPNAARLCLIGVNLESMDILESITSCKSHSIQMINCSSAIPHLPKTTSILIRNHSVRGKTICIDEISSSIQNLILTPSHGFSMSRPMSFITLTTDTDFRSMNSNYICMLKPRQNERVIQGSIVM